MNKKEKICSLTGHTYRVLYLALSPDGETIVSGAGDETLRFWKVFPPTKQNDCIDDYEAMQFDNNKFNTNYSDLR